MTTFASRCVLIGLTASACTSVSPELQLVRDAASSLGGTERVLAVRTMVIEGEGTQYNFGQDLTPDASGQTFTVTRYTRAIEVQAGRGRTEFTRTPTFAFWLGPASQRQIQGIDGGVGYNVASSGNATRVGDAAASDRQAELLRHPVTAIRAALDPSARLSNVRREGQRSLVDVALSGNRAFTLAVDDSTHRLLAVTTLAHNGNLGDVRIATAFADYENVDGLQLPRRLTTTIDRHPSFEVRVTKQTIDPDIDLSAPPAVASAAVPVPAAPTVTVTEVSPGIWQLGGGSHRSVVLEFADRLVLVEAPQNDARALAVIARAREIRPAKPLTHVINTHHHFDHSGGIRAAVSEGLTIVTHQGNRTFFEEIVARPRTLVPDALAKNPKPLKIETVDDSQIMTDGKRTVVVYSVPGPHSSTMLMAYLPAERLLIEGDLYEPSEHVHVFAASLLDEVKRRSLDVDRILPLHSDAAPFSRLVTDAAAPAR